MQALKSLFFSIFMSTTVVFFALAAIILLPLPFSVRYSVISRWAVMNIWLLDKLCGLRYEIQGRENIPENAAVILSKHQSAWETLAFQAIFPPQVWVLKKQLFLIPFFGWGLAALSPIAINRSKRKHAMEQIIAQGRNRLDRGICVVIYPEGTRIKAGYRAKYKHGGARLAESTGYPIIPVAHNAGEFWAKGSFIKKPGTIQVIIGKAIDPSGRSAADISTEVESWIEQQMGEITDKSLLPIKKI